MTMQPNKEEFDRHIGSREEFYSFLLRKRYFLPDIKSSIVTNTFMDEAFKDITFLPFQNMVHPI